VLTYRLITYSKTCTKSSTFDNLKLGYLKLTKRGKRRSKGGEETKEKYIKEEKEERAGGL
jgi:hypothetical protein